MTLLQEQFTVQLIGIFGCSTQFPVDNLFFFLCSQIQVYIRCLCHKIRLHLSFFFGRKYTNSVWKIIIHFHKTNGTDSIEPGISYFFYDSLKSTGFNLGCQSSSLFTLSFIQCHFCSCNRLIYFKVCSLDDRFTA